MPSYHLLRPCKSTAAYEAVPKKDMNMDLDATAALLEKAGYTVENAGVLLIATRPGGGPEATIYQSGKILVKTMDKEVAERAVEAVVAVCGIGRPPRR